MRDANATGCSFPWPSTLRCDKTTPTLYGEASQASTRAPSQDRSAPTDVLRSTKTSPSQKLSAALHLNSTVYLSEAICREAREPWTDLAEICHSNSLVLKKNFSCETFVDAGALWTASTLSSVGCRPFSKICIQDT